MKSLACAASSSVLALERLALVFAEATPDAGVLVFLDCVLEAHGRNTTFAANSFSLFDLLYSGSSVADREEKFWVFIEATGLV